MPSFKDNNMENVPTKKLTPDETLHAVQLAITSECKTIRVYQQILGGTDNAVVRDIIAELSDDAMHNAGALLKLLYTLSPDAARQYEIGAQKALADLGLAGILPNRPAE